MSVYVKREKSRKEKGKREKRQGRDMDETRGRESGKRVGNEGIEEESKSRWRRRSRKEIRKRKDKYFHFKRKMREEDG